jgi:ABC-type transport system substrate-binding protein
MKEWTLFLRKGVPFHFGYGEFTARDVVHSHALMLREEAVATFVGMWRNVEEVKVINAYQVVFRMKGPATTLPYALSRRGDLRMVSKAQWDEVPWNDRRVRQAMNMAINRQEGQAHLSRKKGEPKFKAVSAGRSCPRDNSTA